MCLKGDKDNVYPSIQSILVWQIWLQARNFAYQIYPVFNPNTFVEKSTI